MWSEWQYKQLMIRAETVKHSKLHRTIKNKLRVWIGSFLKVLKVETVSLWLALFEQLCSSHGGHGGHGGHGYGGHSDIFEDGLCHTRVRDFVLTESPNDHLAHFPAGITTHRQQCLDVLLSMDSKKDNKPQQNLANVASTCRATASWTPTL